MQRQFCCQLVAGLSVAGKVKQKFQIVLHLAFDITAVQIQCR